MSIGSMKKMLILSLINILMVIGAEAQSGHNFTEQYTFEQKNGGNARQFSAFLEPKTGTWLLTKDDTFNGEVEDINQWILKPNGQIIVLGEDEFGKAAKLTYKNYGLKNSVKSLTQKPTGKPKLYGTNEHGWPTFTGYPYSISVGRMKAKVVLFKGKNNFAPLYAYNFCLDIEHYLPGFSKVNYAEIIPKNYLLLEDDEVKLISVSPSEYYLEISK